MEQRGPDFCFSSCSFLPTGITAVGLPCLPWFTCSSGINVKLGHNCVCVYNNTYTCLIILYSPAFALCLFLSLFLLLCWNYLQRLSLWEFYVSFSPDKLILIKMYFFSKLLQFSVLKHLDYCNNSVSKYSCPMDLNTAVRNCRPAFEKKQPPWSLK